MSLDTIGAGIAAKQRLERNNARATDLAGVVLSAQDRQSLDALRACGIHRWGLLWEGAKPALHIVTDHYDATGKLTNTEQLELPAAALNAPDIWRR
jgi:hypothetical protein